MTRMEGFATRPYALADRDACMAILRSNMPRYIAPEEETDFIRFLDMLPRDDVPYLVVEDADAAVIACGGLAIEADKTTASLCWGLVAATHHGRRIGHLMLTERLGMARAHQGITRIELQTSQHTQGFFEKYGFVAGEVVKDGYGPGIDRVDMALTL
jgi:predicted GNAT family N-acyltransferase